MVQENPNNNYFVHLKKPTHLEFIHGMVMIFKDELQINSTYSWVKTNILSFRKEYTTYKQSKEVENF